MRDLLVNIDVPDLDAAVAFYTSALGLSVGRRFGGDAVELLGAPVRIYLLVKPAATRVTTTASAARDYRRHWTPMHLDVVVEDLEAALHRAECAGATREGELVELI